MANSYLQFSFMAFEKITAAERLWLEEREDSTWWETNHEEEYMGFSMEVEKGDILWIWAEESGFVDNVAWLIRHFLARFRPRDHVVFEWAYFCDKLRLDEFGGGACLVTAKSEVFFHPLTMAEQYAQDGESHPHVADYGDAGDRLREIVDEDPDTST